MSKNKLLEESTIRTFMKLANLQPLTNKFLKENNSPEESSDEDDEGEEEKLEEVEVTEGDVTEESKTLTSQKPAKMDAAKNAQPDAKLKPLKAGTHHSDKPDSIETKDHSNAPKKNNSTSEVVTENVEEVPSDEGDMLPADAAGESEEHQGSVKDAVHKILSAVSQIAKEYGIDMDVSSGEEVDQPEDTSMEPDVDAGAGAVDDTEAKLEEMVEKLTKRVAARLVKETKSKA